MKAAEKIIAAAKEGQYSQTRWPGSPGARQVASPNTCQFPSPDEVAAAAAEVVGWGDMTGKGGRGFEIRREPEMIGSLELSSQRL